MRAASEIAQLVVAGVVPDLAYLALGLWMLRPLGLAARGAERLALAFVLGSGVASLAILVLRGLDVPVPLVALAGVAVLGVPRLRPDASSGSASAAAGWVRAVDAAALVAAALTVVAALAPETSWDGFEYHLPMVQAWSEGPIRALPAVLDAEFRAGVDLLYLPAVAAGQPDAAAAVSAGFALALAALVRAEARRRASAGAAAIAGLFVLLVPFTLDAAPTTYVDLGVGAYGFLALLSADRWNRTGDARALAVCALGLGFAANAKLHAFALCPAVLVIVAFGGRRPPERVLAGCTGLVLALVAPWLIKSAFTSGNPFFPFLGSWLGTGPTTEQVLSLRRFRLSTDFGMDRGVGDFLRYLASIHFGNNPHVSGLIGPLPLALAPFALRRLSRPTAVLAGALAALFGLQYATMPALRFGAPLLPFLAIAAAVGGARLARTGPPARAILGVAFALLALHHGAALGARYGPRCPSRCTCCCGSATESSSSGICAGRATARSSSCRGHRRTGRAPCSSGAAFARWPSTCDRPIRATGAWATPSSMRGCARGAPRCGPTPIRRVPAAIAGGFSWIWWERTRNSRRSGRRNSCPPASSFSSTTRTWPW
jgi:hypothetical protein